MSIIRHCAGPFPRPSAAAIESGGVANQFNNIGHNFANPVKLFGYRAIGAGRSGFDCADKFTDRPDTRSGRGVNLGNRVYVWPALPSNR